MTAPNKHQAQAKAVAQHKEPTSDIEEVIAVDYQGEPLEIGFNVSYLQDVLSVLGTEQVQISVSDANSSALIEGMGNDDAVYVVMPMRL